MVPLKLMRQRYVLAAEQVFALSSVEVDLPKHDFVLGSSPLSFSHCMKSAASDSDADAISSRSQRWVSWRQKAEDCLWLASALFILYFGDFRSNFFTLLANDVRVWRPPFHMGLGCLLLDSCMVMLAMAIDVQGQGARGQLQAPSVIQAVTLIGSLAFILISVALWPIWNVLTVPMLFTLFMALMVVAPYFLPKLNCNLELASSRYLFVPSSCGHEKLRAS